MPFEQHPDSRATAQPRSPFAYRPAMERAIYARRSRASRTDLRRSRSDRGRRRVHDETMSILKGFNHPRLRLHANPSRVASRNWNRCLPWPRAYVQLLLQDDILYPQAIERLVAALDAVPRPHVRSAAARFATRIPARASYRLSVAVPASAEEFYAAVGTSVSGIDLVRDALRSAAISRSTSWANRLRPHARLRSEDDAGSIRPLRNLSTGDVAPPRTLERHRLRRRGAGVFRIHAAGQSAVNQHRLATAIEMAGSLAGSPVLRPSPRPAERAGLPCSTSSASCALAPWHRERRLRPGSTRSAMSRAAPAPLAPAVKSARRTVPRSRRGHTKPESRTAADAAVS